MDEKSFSPSSRSSLSAFGSVVKKESWLYANWKIRREKEKKSPSVVVARTNDEKVFSPIMIIASLTLQRPSC